jgi:hypothetical protein
MSDALLSSALPNLRSQASEQASLSPLIAESKKTKKLLFQFSKILFSSDLLYKCELAKLGSKAGNRI